MSSTREIVLVHSGKPLMSNPSPVAAGEKVTAVNGLCCLLFWLIFFHTLEGRPTQTLGVDFIVLRFYNSHANFILTLCKVFQITALGLLPWEMIWGPRQWRAYAGTNPSVVKLMTSHECYTHYCHAPPEIRTKILYESKGNAEVR